MNRDDEILRKLLADAQLLQAKYRKLHTTLTIAAIAAAVGGIAAVMTLFLLLLK